MDSLLGFFISDAWAQAGQPTGGGGFQFALMMGGLFVLMYFLMIRPQQKKQKEHRQMVDALAAGDEVVTGGGVLGKITETGEQFLTVEIAAGISVKVQRHTVTTVLPKGTIKAA